MEAPIGVTRRPWSEEMLWDASAIIGYAIEASDGRLGTVSDLLFDDFGWDPYGSGSSPAISNAMAAPFAIPLYEPPLLRNGLLGADTPSKGGDPHLRSIATIIGFHIHASDGGIGHVYDFLVDDAEWNIRYIKVDIRNWWPGQQVLISPLSVREIDGAGKLLHINVSRQQIKDAPPYDPSITVDGAYEEKFLTYYGIRWAAA